MGFMVVTARGEASTETAWQRYLHPRHWTSWAPHLTAVSGETPVIAAGTRGIVRIMYVFTARFRIRQVDNAARIWSWTVRFGPVNLLLEHGLDEDPAGTRAYVRMWGPTPVLMLYRPLMKWALRRLVSVTV